MTEKICKKCGKTKEIGEFSRNKRYAEEGGYNRQCKECVKATIDKDRANARSRAYYRENKEKLLPTRNAWQRANRKKVAEYQVKCRNACPQRIASHRMRNRLYAALRAQRTNKGNSTFDILGIDKEGFFKYFFGLFKDGMTIQDFKNGKIHIDHIIPCSKFDLTKEEELRKCFHYKNLQPSWGKRGKPKKETVSRKAPEEIRHPAYD
jgi:hypothetical protein